VTKTIPWTKGVAAVVARAATDDDFTEAFTKDPTVAVLEYSLTPSEEAAVRGIDFRGLRGQMTRFRTVVAHQSRHDSHTIA